MGAICTSLEISSLTRIQVSVTKGRNQWTFGVWFQRFQSNELIALSQFGQMTFTGLPAFLAGTGSFLYDPTPNTAKLALFVWSVVRRRRHTVETDPHAVPGFPG